jgi:hypothetical protein
MWKNVNLDRKVTSFLLVPFQTLKPAVILSSGHGREYRNGGRITNEKQVVIVSESFQNTLDP